MHLRSDHGDIDVYLTESLNAGKNWTTPVRINDDPIANNKMQDMLWADFDTDGDLVISWRDRRNGSDSTFQTETEIWAAFRDKDSVRFRPNFHITTQLVDYDSDMGEAGNDFMCIKLQDDTLSAVWGDPRDGELNIWFQRMTREGIILSTSQIAKETVPLVIFYPNPTSSILKIQGDGIQSVEIFSFNGQRLWFNAYVLEHNTVDINMESFVAGSYLVKVKTISGEFSSKIVKQ